MKLEKIKNQIGWIGLIILAALAGYIYVVHIINSHLIMDEAFTLGLIRHSITQTIQIDAMDVHPPLYYLVLKVIMAPMRHWHVAIHTQIIWLRLFSIICLAMTLLGFSRSSEALGYKPRWWVFIVFLLMPSVIVYADQIRMYQFASALIAWLIYALIRYHQSKRRTWLIIAVFFASLAAYTHYFAAVLAGLLLLASWIFEAVKHHWKDANTLIIAMVMYLLLFIPWGIVAIRQIMTVKGSYWITSLDSWSALPGIFGPNDSLGYIIGILILAFYVLSIWQHGYDQLNQLFTVVIIALLGVYLIGILPLAIGRPILIGRYLYPGYSVFIFFGLVLVDRFKWRIPQVIPAMLICGGLIWFISGNITSTFNQAQKAAAVPTQVQPKFKTKQVLLDYPVNRAKHVYVDGVFDTIVTHPRHQFYMTQALYDKLVPSHHTRLLFQSIYPNLVIVHKLPKQPNQ